ncbi:MAG: hypothetical protein Q7T84_09665, partial [Phenylobacterium sp.]|nr:hypothetical protein [Phenylobacterium sp.]
PGSGGAALATSRSTSGGGVSRGGRGRRGVATFAAGAGFGGEAAGVVRDGDPADRSGRSGCGGGGGDLGVTMIVTKAGCSGERSGGCETGDPARISASKAA